MCEFWKMNFNINGDFMLELFWERDGEGIFYIFYFGFVYLD